MPDKPFQIVVGQQITETKIVCAKRLRSTMTPTEIVLWKCLRANQFHNYHFRRQQIIEGYIADFYCHQRGLVIEIDGNTHDAEADGIRDAVFAARGIRTLRFQNWEIYAKLEDVLNRILLALEEDSKVQNEA